MAWWIWILIIIFVPIFAFLAWLLFSGFIPALKMQKDIARAGGEEAWHEGIQKKIRQNDERIRRNDERIRQNDERVAANNRSSDALDKIEHLINQNVFTAEEIKAFEYFAKNDTIIINENSERTAAVTDAIHESVEMIKAQTKLILKNLSGNMEKDKEIYEWDKKIKAQDEKIQQLYSFKQEQNDEITAIHNEITRWLELGQSRLSK